MTERAAILRGAGAIWQQWWIVGLAGAMWMLLGLFLFANALFGGVPIRPAYLATPLVLDGVLSLAAAFGQAAMGRGIRFVKVGFFLAVAIVIVATAGRAEMAVGILVGIFLITDAAWRVANAYVVRSDGWHRAIAYAAVEALLGIWSLLSYPAQGVVGSDVSLLIMNSASNLCVLAARLRRLRLGAPVPRAPSAAW
jgi:hypothetical protein